MRLLDISLEQHVLESVVQVKATLEGLVDFLGDGRVAVVRGGIGAEGESVIRDHGVDQLHYAVIGDVALAAGADVEEHVAGILVILHSFLERLEVVHAGSGHGHEVLGVIHAAVGHLPADGAALAVAGVGAMAREAMKPASSAVSA